MQDNGTLLHEVILEISTKDCFRISVTRAFSILHWSAMQIGPSPTFHFMEWRDVERWRLFCSVVHLVKN